VPERTPSARRLRTLAGLAVHPRRIPRRLQARRRELQRRRLLAQLPKDAVCAEIGTWRGDFAATILDNRRPRRLYLVDPWEYRTEAGYERAIYGGRKGDGQQMMDATYERVLARFRGPIDGGQVVVQRSRSLDAAAAFDDESLDWVYIDADHSYEGVKNDLDAYFRTVKPGGFIAGDDYGQVGSWFEDGVTRAVDEFAGRCAGMRVIGTQFLLKKP
jgi:hypothetical protein